MALQNGGADFGSMLSGAGRQLMNQGGQALLQYGAQAIGNIINEVFQKKEVEQKRFLPSIKNYKVVCVEFILFIYLQAVTTILILNNKFKVTGSSCKKNQQNNCLSLADRVR